MVHPSFFPYGNPAQRNYPMYTTNQTLRPPSPYQPNMYRPYPIANTGFPQATGQKPRKKGGGLLQNLKNTLTGGNKQNNNETYYPAPGMPPYGMRGPGMMAGGPPRMAPVPRGPRGAAASRGSVNVAEESVVAENLGGVEAGDGIGAGPEVAGVAATEAAAATGAAGLFGGGFAKLEQYMNTADQLYNTYQKYSPMVKQISPMFQNIPAMYKLYKGFQSMPDANPGGGATARAASGGTSGGASNLNTGNTGSSSTGGQNFIQTPRASRPRIFQPPF